MRTEHAHFAETECVGKCAGVVQSWYDCERDEDSCSDGELSLSQPDSAATCMGCGLPAHRACLDTNGDCTKCAAIPAVPVVAA